MSTPVGDAAQAAAPPAAHPAPAKRAPMIQRVTDLEEQLAALQGFVTQMAADVGRELGL